MRISLTALSMALLLGAGAPAFAQFGFPDGGRRDDRRDERFDRREGDRRREFGRQQEMERQRAMERQREAERPRGGPGGPIVQGRGAVTPTGCPAGMARVGNDCELRRR